MTEYRWANIPWKKDDDFLKVRAQLEKFDWNSLQKEFAEGENWPTTLPTPLQLFRYSTAAYLGVAKFREKTADSYVVKALQLFDKVFQAESTQFCRIRFLLTSYLDTDIHLKNLGLQLCKLDRKDYDVRFYLCKSLKPDQYLENRSLALKLCDEMQRISPKRPSAYASRGATLFRCWLAERKDADRIGALASYNKYLSLLPANDPARSNLKFVMDMLMQKTTGSH